MHNSLLDSQDNRVEFTLLLTAGRKVIEQMAAQINQDLAIIGMKINLQFPSFNAKVKQLNLSKYWEAYLVQDGRNK